MEIVYTFLVMISILIFHELGHMYWAYFMKLKIYGIGITYKPVPHVFVAAEFTRNRLKRTCYYLGGPLSTIALFIIVIYFGLIHYSFIKYAFIYSLVIESNPFFSDITTLIILKQNEQQATQPNFFSQQIGILINEFLFTPLWYVHFFLWSLYIFLIIKIVHFFI